MIFSNNRCMLATMPNLHSTLTLSIYVQLINQLYQHYSYFTNEYHVLCNLFLWSYFKTNSPEKFLSPLSLCTQICCTVILCLYRCKCVIVWITYGVLMVMFVISLMCLFAFVFVVFMWILCNKMCVNFYNHFAPWFFVLHSALLHIGAVESGCKGRWVFAQNFGCTVFFATFGGIMVHFCTKKKSDAQNTYAQSTCGTKLCFYDAHDAQNSVEQYKCCTNACATEAQNFGHHKIRCTVHIGYNCAAKTLCKNPAAQRLYTLSYNELSLLLLSFFFLFFFVCMFCFTQQYEY